jgi:hypothetical protein
MVPIFNQKIPNLNSGGDIQSVLIKGFCVILSFFEIMLGYFFFFF